MVLPVWQIEEHVRQHNALIYVELEKQSFCDLKVVNNKENYVAFKVKTTSPKKYFVRPNTGVIQPWDSCIIRGAELSNGKVAETKVLER
ncbi:hypothetical protein Ahy_A08g039296 isoform C [Arachis hypogaea]|uniref:MSP domain-containing protein n=1 Tax=Arachis hypogaea TaxID=3818 RepID=A0A445BVV2_ARAHY|nr:hypothetical protein Ahy_A08g039296 isoform C [Arachis hypogaea]